MSAADPTEATWTRYVENDPPHFVFAIGRWGPWRFWQGFDQGVLWTEDEMQAVDEVMRRIARIDQSTWTFRKFDFESGDRLAKYDVSKQSQSGYCVQADTFDDLLTRLELLAFGFSIRSENETCKWCDYPRKPDVELFHHVEAEHPEELARLRAEHQERIDFTRNYFRRRAATYHPDIDGPREPRRYIL